jgi:hypothetical protein
MDGWWIGCILFFDTDTSPTLRAVAHSHPVWRDSLKHIARIKHLRELNRMLETRTFTLLLTSCHIISHPTIISSSFQEPSLPFLGHSRLYYLTNILSTVADYMYSHPYKQVSKQAIISLSVFGSCAEETKEMSLYWYRSVLRGGNGNYREVGMGIRADMSFLKEATDHGRGIRNVWVSTRKKAFSSVQRITVSHPQPSLSWPDALHPLHCFSAVRLLEQ